MCNVTIAFVRAAEPTQFAVPCQRVLEAGWSLLGGISWQSERVVALDIWGDQHPLHVNKDHVLYAHVEVCERYEEVARRAAMSATAQNSNTEATQ